MRNKNRSKSDPKKLMLMILRVSVCEPDMGEFAAEGLRDSDVKVCTVIGFPLEQIHHLSKRGETKNAIQNGADEIDMVMNIGALKV